MKKNLFILFFTLLIVTLTAQPSFTEYTDQEIITLDTPVASLGYSQDQKHLVVLPVGVKEQFYVYEGVRMNKKVPITITDDETTVSIVSFEFSNDNSMLVVGTSEGSVYGFVI